MRLTLIVEETLASEILEAYLFVICDPDHKAYPRGSLKSDPEIIGPTDIRRKIVNFSFSPACISRKVSMRASSAFLKHCWVDWTGRCFDARETLWNDISTGTQLCPEPNEWVIISGTSRGMEATITKKWSNARMYCSTQLSVTHCARSSDSTHFSKMFPLRSNLPRFY